MYAPDFDCDPYHNPTIYDTNPNFDTTIYEQLILTQTINVPFHEFAKRTNMNLSTTGKQKDDTSHPTVHQADEDHDTEITVLVTPPSENIKSILKNYFNPLPTGLQSPQKLPVATNEIQEAMTLSPSSRESPEHKNVGQIAPKTAMKPGTILEGHNLQQHHVHASIPQVIARQQGCRLVPHQPTTQRNGHHKPSLKRKMCPNLFSHYPEEETEHAFRTVGFMDFNNQCLDALIDAEALVNCLPRENSIKSISPDNVLKEM